MPLARALTHFIVRFGQGLPGGGERRPYCTWIKSHSSVQCSTWYCIDAINRLTINEWMDGWMDNMNCNYI